MPRHITLSSAALSTRVMTLHLSICLTPGLMNDTVCAIFLYWTSTNRSGEINQKSNKTKQKDDKKKSAPFVFPSPH